MVIECNIIVFRVSQDVRILCIMVCFAGQGTICSIVHGQKYKKNTPRLLLKYVYALYWQSFIVVVASYCEKPSLLP